MISPKIDRRRAPRHPVQQIGMILVDPGATPHYCLIVDKSNGGVRVRTTSDFQAPSEFLLRCADTEFKYKVVWCNGSLLGAMLINWSAADMPMRRSNVCF
jgi:PilZ domain